MSTLSKKFQNAYNKYKTTAVKVAVPLIALCGVQNVSAQNSTHQNSENFTQKTQVIEGNTAMTRLVQSFSNDKIVKEYEHTQIKTDVGNGYSIVETDIDSFDKSGSKKDFSIHLVGKDGSKADITHIADYTNKLQLESNNDSKKGMIQRSKIISQAMNSCSHLNDAQRNAVHSYMHQVSKPSAESSNAKVMSYTQSAMMFQNDGR